MTTTNNPAAFTIHAAGSTNPNVPDSANATRMVLVDSNRDGFRLWHGIAAGDTHYRIVEDRGAVEVSVEVPEPQGRWYDWTQGDDCADMVAAVDWIRCDLARRG